MVVFLFCTALLCYTCLIMNKQLIHRAFITTVLANCIIALGDTVVGFFFVYKRLLNFFPFLAKALAHTDHIGAFYFFSHGAVKLFLVWGLARQKLWAYPTAMSFLTAFNIYQIYLLIDHFSWFVAGLLVFNSLSVIVISIEYRQVQKLFIEKNT